MSRPSMVHGRAHQVTPVTQPDWARHGKTRTALAALGCLLLLVLFSGEIRDTDVWLHLKTGEQTLHTRALTVPDPFSYTSARPAISSGEEAIRYFNLTHEWLAQALMYLIWAVAGFPGLVLARAALLAAFCALTGWIVYRRRGDFYLSLAAALASAGVAFQFQQSRPFLATFVGLALTIAILESRRGMWALPAIFLVWSNCHGGFFTGWIALGAYCGEALVARLRKQPAAGERTLWLVAAASVAVSALNPNGYGVLRVLLLYRSSAIQSDNLEWQRPAFWEPGIHSFLLFGSLAALLWAGRRARISDWLLYAGFGAMALLAVRNAMFMGLIGPIMIASYVPLRRWLAPAAAVVSVGLLVVFDVTPAAAQGNLLALRTARWQLPAGAADFIAARHIDTPMFNGYESGGYLVWRLWPLQRVFIDSLGLSEEAYADYRRILMNDHAAALLAKYGIGLIVIEGFDFLSGQVYPLAVEVAKGQTDWKLVHADPQAAVFLLRPPPSIPALPPGALLESLDGQCEEHLRHDPSRPLCARGLGELYGAMGDVDRATHWIARYAEYRHGPDPETDRIEQSLRVTRLNNQALALEEKGDLSGAELLLQQALTTAETGLGPDNADTAGTLNNLADLLENEGRYDAAEPLYRRSLSIAEKTLGPADPRTAVALENLAGLLAAKGDLAAAEPLYARAAALVEKSLGVDDPATRNIREEWNALRKELARRK